MGSEKQARKLAAAEKKIAARWLYESHGDTFRILGPESADRSRPIIATMDASLGHDVADFITSAIQKAWDKK